MTNQLHFPGDVTDFEPDSFVGADKFGAFYRPIEATYDAGTDTTAIQYKPIPPADMPRYAEDKVRQMQDRAALIEPFGGHW